MLSFLHVWALRILDVCESFVFVIVADVIARYVLIASNVSYTCLLSRSKSLRTLLSSPSLVFKLFLSLFVV